MRWPTVLLLFVLIMACGGDPVEGSPTAGGPSTPGATNTAGSTATAPATMQATAPTPPGTEATGTSTTVPASSTRSPAAPTATTAPPTQPVPTSANVTATAAFQWSPAVAEVGVGGTVNWSWVSTEPHNIAGQGFELHEPTTNGAFSFTFSTPGTYFYNCVVHVGMEGQVVVR